MKPNGYVVMFVLAVGGGTKKKTQKPNTRLGRLSTPPGSTAFTEDSSPAYHASIIQDFIKEHLLFN